MRCCDAVIMISDLHSQLLFACCNEQVSHVRVGKCPCILLLDLKNNTRNLEVLTVSVMLCFTFSSNGAAVSQGGPRPL